MSSQNKPSRHEIDSKFTDMQKRIIEAPDNATAEQVIAEQLSPLENMIYQSDDLGEINPLGLVQHVRDHVNNLRVTASPSIVPLYHLERQIQPTKRYEQSGPPHNGTPPGS